MRPFRSSPCRAVLAVALLAAAGPAFPAASGAPFGYAPDPALKTETAAQLEGRVKRSCATTQASLQSVPETKLTRPCGCYANKVMTSLSPAEVDAYRGTGVFNEGARQKAFAAIDECKLKRPI